MSDHTLAQSWMLSKTVTAYKKIVVDRENIINIFYKKIEVIKKQKEGTKLAMYLMHIYHKFTYLHIKLACSDIYMYHTHAKMF